MSYVLHVKFDLPDRIGPDTPLVQGLAQGVVLELYAAHGIDCDMGADCSCGATKALQEYILLHRSRI